MHKVNRSRFRASIPEPEEEAPPKGLLDPSMFTTHLHQPATHYRGGMSRKAAWQGCAVSNVAGAVRSFGRSPAFEVPSSLTDRDSIAKRNPEAHP